MKKLILVALAGLMLGGCTLPNWKQEAAKDQQIEPPVATMEEQTVDPELAQTPGLSSDNQVEDLEKDINDTEIMEEDFADLEP